ncbi:phosphoribosylaminoimidazole carboxylase [Dictyostelium discoideum AX4]|uniref:Bifunctional purine synthesis protein purC/E n=1 Tax=Dictyostelium discoideum TaxID=44689 RepID=PURCE_DICDI|nr:phosphoribosylaminoimidazole carboxylase [Dictyostelium discoideum AX4]Q54QE4.1 RecName: Full=Bifunctional purine synthesis protein purC/E; Includes: RecName: Full=Phosphoribosylaminoimidazole-succinocarboxamide synthase; AltName: Full=SAICAR synthetase; Includes: RecName: Full=Phosphoribosylaminoimidazole carboxylase; AltName: Full=AIR carboxylase; Short=AIRC [Dictyostelium discoideum]EAL65481.1 phosphoribosylaminoimidazole carboxylase [Dictyostelium discoideum AX4]|eukprot:XP_638800.1 phosphoribosylaminoimidazole carboxylase [Dictyostelium discoideum AX4]
MTTAINNNIVNKEFDLKDKTFLASGKTKTIYQLNKEDQYVLIESNSAITAGDGAKKDILPNKDIYSTTTTVNNFKVLQLSGINTHFVKQVEPNAFIAKKCSMIPLEVIVRRLATGSYLKRNTHVTEGTKFNPPLIEFTFKDDVQHDPLVTEQDILEMNLKIGGVPITSKLLSQTRHIATLSFEALERAWQSLDVTLVDFKVEFGITSQGELILADVIDNDSWRIWPKGDKTLMKDKQVYRNLPSALNTPGATPTTQSGPLLNTLSDQQLKMIEDNYAWVATSTEKLVEFTAANLNNNNNNNNNNSNNNNNNTSSTSRSNSLPNVPSITTTPTLHHHHHHHQQQQSGVGNNNNVNSGFQVQLNQPLVGIIMGSQSDWETMKLAANTLTTLGVPFETRIVSAHRTPDRLFEYAKTAKSRGLKIVIAGAGGAAHLPGMVAALTPLPVFGVPVQSKALSGVDSLLSIVQMPAGIPVGTVAIGAAGATNAALLSAAVLAPYYPSIELSLDLYRKKQTDAVAEIPVDNPTSTSTTTTTTTTSNATSILSAIHTSTINSNTSSHNNNQQQQQQQQTILPTQPTIINTPTPVRSSVSRSQSPLPSGNGSSIISQEKTPLSTFVLSTCRPSALVLPPGSTIGILGGGQLARMMAIAAAQLGYKTHIFCPENDPSASHVATYTTKSNYNNYSALDIFARQVDVVTYEFENIMVEPVEYLTKQVAVFPDPKILRTCQDRVLEKTFIQSLDIPTAQFQSVESFNDLKSAIEKIGYPAILKSNTMGYDGKGQVKLTDQVDLEQAWKKVTSETCATKAILEQYIEFESEASVIVARALDGTELTFPLVTNKHRNHILRQTIAPAQLPEYIHKQANEIGLKIARSNGLVGIIAVELFVVKNNETGQYSLMVNELAPRPHNSGHWTIEGCVTSQFEQLIRCVCGLPLGSVDFTKRISEAEFIQQQIPPIVMTNLLGQEVNGWEKILQTKGSHLHIYAKGDAKEGRKMGHVTQQ